MKEIRTVEMSHREWCIRIGEIFDFDAALDCLRQCREDRHFLPDHLRFDLTRTRLLSTAGIGVMLHIRSDYQLAPGHAVIEYQDPQVGELLLLSGMQRSFLVRRQGSHPHIAAPQRQPAACRALGTDSENRPRRDQFSPDLPPHSPAMGQKAGEKWAGAEGLQPVIPKSDRLPGQVQPRNPGC